MSLITIHWRAPPKGGDFLYVVVYMRRALALCSLHDEDIILHILSSAESPGAGPRRLFHNSRRFATRVVQHASLVQDATLLNCTISIQHLPVVVQCTSHSRELGKRRSWSSGINE